MDARRRSSVCEPTFMGDTGLVLVEKELPRGWGCMVPLVVNFLKFYYARLVKQHLDAPDATQKRVDAVYSADDDIEVIIKYTSVTAVQIRSLSMRLRRALSLQLHIQEVAIHEFGKFGVLPYAPIVRLNANASSPGGADEIQCNLSLVTTLLHVKILVNTNIEAELQELKAFFGIFVPKLALSIHIKNIHRSMNARTYVSQLEKAVDSAIAVVKLGLRSVPSSKFEQRVTLIIPKCAELENTERPDVTRVIQKHNGTSLGVHLTHCRYHIPIAQHQNCHLELILKAQLCQSEVVRFDNFLLNSYLD